MPLSIMKFFFVFLHATACNPARNNNGNDPNGFLINFKTAAINATRNVLPQTDMPGCFFNLSSNLRKHIQRAKLQECYMNDPNVVYSYV